MVLAPFAFRERPRLPVQIPLNRQPEAPSELDQLLQADVAKLELMDTCGTVAHAGLRIVFRDVPRARAARVKELHACYRIRRAGPELWQTIRAAQIPIRRLILKGAPLQVRTHGVSSPFPGNAHLYRS